MTALTSRSISSRPNGPGSSPANPWKMCSGCSLSSRPPCWSVPSAYSSRAPTTPTSGSARNPTMVSSQSGCSTRVSSLRNSKTSPVDAAAPWLHRAEKLNCPLARTTRAVELGEFVEHRRRRAQDRRRRRSRTSGTSSHLEHRRTAPSTSGRSTPHTGRAVPTVGMTMLTVGRRWEPTTGSDSGPGVARCSTVASMPRRSKCSATARRPASRAYGLASASPAAEPGVMHQWYSTAGTWCDRRGPLGDTQDQVVVLRAVEARRGIRRPLTTTERRKHGQVGAVVLRAQTVPATSPA